LIIFPSKPGLSPAKPSEPSLENGPGLRILKPEPGKAKPSLALEPGLARPSLDQIFEHRARREVR